MPVWKVRLTGAVADADVAAFAQYTVAFPGDTGRVGKMMIDRRHEHEISAAIRKRKRLCRALSVVRVFEATGQLN